MFSTAVLLFCAASFAGQSFASALDDDLVHVAVTVTTTLYAFVMVLSSYVRRTRDAHDEQRSDVLFISPNTVRTHIHNIYRKLDVSSREDILRLTKG